MMSDTETRPARGNHTPTPMSVHPVGYLVEPDGTTVIAVVTADRPEHLEPRGQAVVTVPRHVDLHTFPPAVRGGEPRLGVAVVGDEGVTEHEALYHPLGP